MSKQRDILPKVLNLVLQQVPDAAVYLSGSVSFGYERPESDVDIIVVVPDVTPACFPAGKVTSQTRHAKVVKRFPKKPTIIRRGWRDRIYLRCWMEH